MLEKDIEKKVLSEKEIVEVVSKLSKEITKDYQDKYPLLVGLLNGCVPFMSDFIKTLDFHLELGFMDVSSYFGGVQSQVDVKIIKDLDVSVQGRDILIVEDIIDSGRTLKAVSELLSHRGAKSVEVVTLLDKPSGREVDYVPKYKGKAIPSLFVVGYGLDYQERYRNLPYVGVLKPEIYSDEDLQVTQKSS